MEATIGTGPADGATVLSVDQLLPALRGCLGRSLWTTLDQDAARLVAHEEDL